MALFDPLDTFTVAVLLFIFGLLVINSGAASSFSSQPLISGASLFLAAPISLLSWAGGGGLLFLGAIALVVLAYFTLTYEVFGEAFWAAVVFCFLVILLRG